MKKILLLAFVSAALHADPTAVAIVNVNSSLVAVLEGAAGIKNAQPYAEVLILHPSSSADGYRIQLTYTDAQSVTHQITRDVVSQVTPDDQPMIQIFYVDAATISATVTPYKLQVGSISAP